jgi:hypothetical protein
MSLRGSPCPSRLASPPLPRASGGSLIKPDDLRGSVVAAVRRAWRRRGPIAPRRADNPRSRQKRANQHARTRASRRGLARAESSGAEGRLGALFWESLWEIRQSWRTARRVSPRRFIDLHRRRDLRADERRETVAVSIYRTEDRARARARCLIEIHVYSSIKISRSEIRALFPSLTASYKTPLRYRSGDLRTLPLN